MSISKEKNNGERDKIAVANDAKINLNELLGK